MSFSTNRLHFLPVCCGGSVRDIIGWRSIWGYAEPTTKRFGYLPESLTFRLSNELNECFLLLISP